MNLFVYLWLLLGLAARIASSPATFVKTHVDTDSNSGRLQLKRGTTKADRCQTQPDASNCDTISLTNIVTVNSESSLNAETQQSTPLATEDAYEFRPFQNFHLVQKTLRVGSQPPSVAETSGVTPEPSVAPGSSGDPIVVPAPAMPHSFQTQGLTDSAGSSDLAAYRKSCIDIHNYYRSKHANTQPVKWNTALEKLASDHASGCVYKHVDRGNRLYGENIAFDQHNRIDTASKEWYSEISFFNFKKQVFSEKLGHFINMAAVHLTDIGCVSHYCKQATFPPDGPGSGPPASGWFHVCEYSGAHSTDKPLVNPLKG